MENQKKILLITYYFPPDPAVGGKRLVNIYNYFNNKDVEAFILTKDEKYISSMDSSLVVKPKNYFTTRVMIHPIQIHDFIYNFFSKIKSLFNSKDKKSNDTVVKKSSQNVTAQESHSAHPSIFSRIKNLILSLELAIDDKSGWIPFCFAKARKVLKENNINTFLTSGPPMSIHVSGLLVKLLTKKKWIAEFRDPWVLGKIGWPRSSLSLKIDKYLEKKTAQNCDILVVTTDTLKNYFVESYGIDDKILLIQNGFNEYRPVKMNTLDNSKMVITYTGTLYIKRDPRTFLAGVKKFVQEKEIKPDKIQIDFVGKCRFFNNIDLVDFVKNLGIQDYVNFIDPVPHSQATEIIKKSHIALLFAQQQPLSIPAKVYEYLSLNKYMLVFTEEGATKNLIEATNSGIIINDHAEEIQISSILDILYDQFNKNMLGVNMEDKVITNYKYDTLFSNLLPHL